MTTLNSQTHPAKPLFGATRAELSVLMQSLGEPAYRATQLAKALYGQRVASFDRMTAIPVALRSALADRGYTVGLPELVQTARSHDGTERYLVRLNDGETVETVWMPEGDMAEEDAATSDLRTAGMQRATICISSQVGCAINCQFCLTAKLGIRRNLTAGEIAGQVAAVLNRHRIDVGAGQKRGGKGNPDRINLVFMGMGEPFLNYDHFIAAVHLLVNELGIAEARMTVSTSGILPAIERYAEEPLRPRLALSLNASNDATRESIMPITRKWNIASLLLAVSQIPLRPKERITFEYVLLGGINDQPEHTEELIALLAGLPAKVNLIVWNAGPDMAFRAPSPERVAAFQRRLRDAGVHAFIRRPRGADIYAACGQLKRTLEVTDEGSSRQAGALVAIEPLARLPA